MAAQSKLSLPSDRSLSALLSHCSNTYLKHRTNISRAVYLTLFIALINRVRNAINEQKSATARQKQQAAGKTSTPDFKDQKQKVELNREFFKNLFKLLRIVIPGVKSKEMRLIVSHSCFLVIRTLISLYVAELDGKLVSSLVRGKGREFLIGIVWWMLVAVPATFTNSMVSLT
jgi:ATP-binding cassette subfamily D (ALD) long-chain fatty acid import protein